MGRLVLDGADFATLARRFDVDEPAIEAAWHMCRQKLTEHLSKTDVHCDANHLYTLEELQQLPDTTLPFLLNWADREQHREWLKADEPEQDDP